MRSVIEGEASILIVEDEAPMITVLQAVLQATGYDYSVAASIADARHLLLISPPDLVLLDLGLPDGDGKSLIEPATAAGAGVIIVSARHMDLEKIECLDRGADDYVDKPYEIGILMARVRAALRRHGTSAEPPSRYVNGPLRVDLTTRSVSLGGEAVRLSPKEWALLATLVGSAGQVVTHKRLLAAGWGSAAADMQYLRVYMGLLRQKIEEDSSLPRLILTEPGIGYRLSARE